MAMFEQHGTGDVILESNSTDKEQMLKKFGDGSVTARDNKSHEVLRAPQLPFSKRLRAWVVGNIVAIIVGVVGGCLGTLAAQWLTAKYGLPH